MMVTIILFAGIPNLRSLTKILMTSLPNLLTLLTSGICWSIINYPTIPAIGLATEPTPAVTSSTVTANTLIVPGKSVGAITAKTTYIDLVKLFGKERLTAKKVYGAEGQVEFPGTLISSRGKKLMIVAWKDAKKLQPLNVTIFDSGWKTTEGIGVGMSLPKLRNILGEFKISGLYWDYGNQVIDLSPATQVRYSGMSISVDADPQAAKQFPADLQAVLGDMTLSADDPHWQRLKMKVTNLTVYFRDSSIE
jgi:hypothetical protein